MQTEKVHLSKEKETMLVTLYGRAMESRSKDPVLRDVMAEEAIGRIDYDFERTKPDALNSLSIAIRAKQFDLWTLEFLSKHPQATVVHLGCGLDSRVYRIDPPAGVQWFDVDYPEIIDLRRQLYPERSGYQMIGSSILEPGWLDEVPGDKPTWILAEGVMMYLPEDGVKPLFNSLTSHFPSGEMAFDAVNKQGAKMAAWNKSVRKAGASFGWGIDDPNDIKLLDPKMELVTELSTPDLPRYDKLPGHMRAIVRFMDLFPGLRRLNRLLRYRF